MIQLSIPPSLPMSSYCYLQPKPGRQNSFQPLPFAYLYFFNSEKPGFLTYNIFIYIYVQPE